MARRLLPLRVEPLGRWRRLPLPRQSAAAPMSAPLAPTAPAPPTRAAAAVVAVALAVALLALGAVPAAAQPTQPPREPGRRDVFPPQVPVADAASMEDVVAAARALPRGGRMTISRLPLGAGDVQVALGLERVEVFSDDAEIVVHRAAGEDRISPPPDAWLRGGVVGEADTLALLTVPVSGLPRGLISRRGRIFTIRGDGPEAALGRGRLMAPEAPPAREQAFDCRLDDVAVPDLVRAPPRGPLPVPVDPAGGPGVPGFPGGPAVAWDDTAWPEAGGLEPGGLDIGGLDAVAAQQVALAAVSPTHTARVAIETDHEFFQRFGSRAAATEYVADLFAYISALYAREVGTTLEVVHLSLWDSAADPWTQSSASCGMYEFGRYWNRNRGSVDRTIAHFLSGKPPNAGIAWLGVLCRSGFVVDHGGACPTLSPQRDDYGGAYGFTGGISGSFTASSTTLVWDVLGVAHEIGHNFDSPHTHCYGGLGGVAQPVDECSNSECGRPGCFCGTPRLPCPTAGAGCGTVMSYCHLLSGNVRNTTFTLGEGHPWGVQPQRVPQRMRTHVAERAQLDPSCLALSANQPPCDDLVLADRAVSGVETHSTCGTLFAGPSVRVTATGALTLSAGRVVLRDGFSVAAGGRLTVATLP